MPRTIITAASTKATMARTNRTDHPSACVLVGIIQSLWLTPAPEGAQTQTFYDTAFF
jgi:hypothetical protein